MPSPAKIKMPTEHLSNDSVISDLLPVETYFPQTGNSGNEPEETDSKKKKLHKSGQSKYLLQLEKKYK